jgi:hypothetical protein
MNNHIFQNHCVDFEEILDPKNWVKNKCLDRMLRSAYDQSKTEEAKLRVDFANYKDYDQDEWCPIYFGMFTEWLAWHFFNHYGRLFNVEGCEMLASEGNSEQDLGTDGRMRSIQRQAMKTTFRIAEKGSPVYLQVKGTMNKTKIFLRANGNNSIGLGHIMRLESIEMMLKNHFECIYILREEDSEAISILETKTIIKIPIQNDLLEESNWIATNCLTGKELIVLDGYNFNTEYQNILKANCLKMIFIEARILGLSGISWGLPVLGFLSVSIITIGKLLLVKFCE